MPHRYRSHLHGCGRLKYAAEELGYDLKVETQGSSGNEKLAQADIDAADAVIFAVSVNVRERNRLRR